MKQWGYALNCHFTPCALVAPHTERKQLTMNAAACLSSGIINRTNWFNNFSTMIPEQIDPSGLSDYLEVMTKAVFQAGVSWALVDSKWSAFKRAFKHFDPLLVATFGDDDIEQLMADSGILRSRNKIVATINNAKTMLALEKEFATFANYLHSKSGLPQFSRTLI